MNTEFQAKTPTRKFILLLNGQPLTFGSHPFKLSWEAVEVCEADTYPERATALRVAENMFHRGTAVTIKELSPDEAAASKPRSKKIYTLREAMAE